MNSGEISAAESRSIRFFSDRELLAAGADPSALTNPAFVKANGVLDDIDLFDAGFFGFSARDAEILDPQHRFFLECAWKRWRMPDTVRETTRD